MKAAEYERVVQQIAQKSEDGARIDSTSDYEVEQGSPLRVAFLWPGSVVDNRATIVYDASDELAALASVKGRILDAAKVDSNIRSLSQIFGGNVIVCYRLKKNWYYCYFT
jgi:hypothetical protein